MTRTILQDIAKLPALRVAWQKISKGKLNRPTANRPGHDGKSLQSVEARLEAELRTISIELLDNRFQFSPLDPFLIPKPDGKFRVICVPTVADRITQRAILDAIQDKQAWMANPISFGFVAGGGVEKALSRAIKLRNSSPWVFKTDISKFFDKVDRNLLKAEVSRKIKQKSVHQLLYNAIDCEIKIENKNQEGNFKRIGIIPKIGVRQGMPLSPLFANLFLADFDKECIQRHIKAIRYADDLIFFANTEDEARSLQSFCKEELEKINLQIPDLVSGAKSQIYSPMEAAEFLGVEICRFKEKKYIVNIGQKQLHKIKEQINALGSLKELKNRNLNMSKFGTAIDSRIAAYSSTYEFCSNHAQLAASLDVWSLGVKQKLAKELGIDIANLTDDGKWFLGI